MLSNQFLIDFHRKVNEFNEAILVEVNFRQDFREYTEQILAHRGNDIAEIETNTSIEQLSASIREPENIQTTLNNLKSFRMSITVLTGLLDTICPVSSAEQRFGHLLDLQNRVKQDIEERPPISRNVATYLFCGDSGPWRRSMFDLTLLMKGSSAEIYRADLIRSSRTYAIKSFRVPETWDQRTLEAINYHAFLHSSSCHPNIPQFYDIFEDEQSVNFLMEYVGGTDLTEYLELTGPLDENTGALLISQLSAALAYLHKESFVHGAVIPEHIVIGSSLRVKLVGFGHASKLTSLKHPIDSAQVEYLAPEMIQDQGGPSDSKVDSWGVGVIMYQMFERQTPFCDESTAKLLANILHQKVPIIQNASEELNNLVAKVRTLLDLKRHS